MLRALPACQPGLQARVPRPGPRLYEFTPGPAQGRGNQKNQAQDQSPGRKPGSKPQSQVQKAGSRTRLFQGVILVRITPRTEHSKTVRQDRKIETKWERKGRKRERKGENGACHEGKGCRIVQGRNRSNQDEGEILTRELRPRPIVVRKYLPGNDHSVATREARQTYNAALIFSVFSS